MFSYQRGNPFENGLRVYLYFSLSIGSFVDGLEAENHS